jgi:two-component system, sensor histidine kinase RegB
MERSNSTLLRTLVNLRWMAVIGQTLTIAFVVGVLGLALDVTTLAFAIAALAAFNAWAGLRLRSADEASNAEVLLHIGVDVAELAWLIAWSGGVVNPFTSLFLLPIAFAALALPGRWLMAVAALCASGYGASILLGRPLPHVHGIINGFNLHLVGMSVNFVVSGAVLLYFLARTSSLLRQREHELSLLRERFARNEGIVALATHAASVAHELNTPLATMTLIIDDLIEDDVDARQAEDHRTIRSLIDVCRDRVRALAAPARAGEGNGTDDGDRVELGHVIARWQLVRPTVSLVREGDASLSTRVDVAIGHLLQALLNNAADAGVAGGAARVDLHLDLRDGSLHGSIRDYGDGFDEARPFLPGRLFESSKHDGLGVGLALSHATVERLGGDLRVENAEGRGVRVSFRLPLTPAEEP